MKDMKLFCDLIQNHTSKLIENQISSNLRITSTEDNNILHNNFNDVNSNLNIFTESEKLETQSKHVNWKASNFDLHNLVKDYENNPIIGNPIILISIIYLVKLIT